MMRGGLEILPYLTLRERESLVLVCLSVLLCMDICMRAAGLDRERILTYLLYDRVFFLHPFAGSGLD